MGVREGTFSTPSTYTNALSEGKCATDWVVSSAASHQARQVKGVDRMAPPLISVSDKNA
jgi:hypothetical protein